MKLAHDTALDTILNRCWMKLESLIEEDDTKGTVMVWRLDLTDAIVAHMGSNAKISHRLTQSLVFIIYRALLHKNTPQPVALKLLECLLRAFNRGGEDQSILFKPKVPSLFWFEVKTA